jgi:PBP1b-binding outer membrane lipoprotein LpoB
MITLLSMNVNASTYEGSADFEITVSTASDIVVTFDNDGIVQFEDLQENDEIDTVASYEIDASASRSFSCSIEINGVHYNTGDNINTYLKDSSGSNTTHVITMNYLDCDNGYNDVVITGTVGGSLDSNDTYYIDTQFVGVSYVPGTITSYL